MDTNTTPTTPAPKRAPRKVTKAAKAPAKAAPAKASTKVPLKAICAKMGIEPKAARRKLRRSELGFHGLRDRWSFTPAQAEKVRELLKSLTSN